MAKYKLLLPRMGESVAEATIIKWQKNIGDAVEMDEAVMEIATDKVDSEVPSPVKGILILRLCNENDVVQVGSVIAIIETDEPEEMTGTILTSPNLSNNVTNEPVNFEQPPVYQQFVEQPPVHDHTFVEPIIDSFSIPGLEQLPPPAPEPEKPAVLRFYSPLVKNIASQEGISQAELDSIPGSGAEGRLTKDDLLLYIQNKVAKASAPKTEGVNTPVAESTFFMQESYQKPAEETIPTPPNNDLFIAPEFAAEQPATVPQESVATQPDKTINQTGTAKSTASAQPKTEPTPQHEPRKFTVDGAGDEIIEMDRMRRLIADHMVASVQTSPHVTSFIEADVTNLVLWRDKVKKDFEKREGTKITFTPIFIEAVARAIKDFPMVNVQVKGTQIIVKKNINIGMATALPSGNLIVPVIRNADELNIIGLTKTVNDLAGRARNNKLLPDEVQGGTFTITNVGTFGNLMGTPIINQPQVAILALGAIKKKPAVIETESGDMIAIRHMMYLSLSYDHRVVDGSLGGSFIRRVADYLEAWEITREI